MSINERFAFLTAPNGKKYQVLNEDHTAWDEVATAEAYAQGEGAP